MRESLVATTIVIVLILIAAVIATWGIARIEGLLTL
jgi:hypothetical protein